MNILKLLLIKTIRLAARLFHVFPVQKNKILFMSFHGGQYSCNPKYIYEYLLKANEGKYHCIWCLEEKYAREGMESFSPSNRLLYFWHNLTAKVVVLNTNLRATMPYRANQIVLQTWHGGGAYKKMGFDFDASFYVRCYAKMNQKTNAYFLSSSKGFSDVIKSAWAVDEKRIIASGMPRNDIFFEERQDIIDKVYAFYHLPKDTGIILYAPTYKNNVRRAETVSFAVDETDAIIEAFNKRFHKNHVLMIRFHHTVHKTASRGDKTVDGRMYDDMQELLYAADALITDYSSCIWDFCLTRKPLFLYIPDIERYAGDWGLYTPIEKWGFPPTKTVAALLKNIHEFDDAAHKKAAESHLAMLGSYENGTASKRAVDLIEGYIRS